MILTLGELWQEMAKLVIRAETAEKHSEELNQEIAKLKEELQKKKVYPKDEESKR